MIALKEYVRSQVKKAVEAKSRKSSTQVVPALAKVLAETYLLYLKTQGFHWNVRGSTFSQLHSFFQDLYEDLSEGADLVAEQIRQLGEIAPASFQKFSQLSSITEVEGAPSDSEMVSILYQDNKTLSESCNQGIKVAEQAGDQATVDILVQRKQAHDKASWMLKSTLEGA